MARKTEISEWSVVVTSDRIGGSVANLRSDCDAIAGAIRRHVDDVGRIEVTPHYERTCEHCGANWTEPSTTYNGGCCEADEAGNPWMRRHD